MKVDLICRVCLKEGKLKSIFDLQRSEGGQTVSCSDMMVFCASVTVDKSDGYPCHICTRCFKKLCTAYKFRNLCEKSFECLKNYFMENKAPLIEIKIENQDDKTLENFDCKNEPDIKQRCMNITLVGEVKIENDDADYPDVPMINDVNDDDEFDDEDNIVLAVKQKENSKSLKDDNPDKPNVTKDNKSKSRNGRVKKEMLKCQFCPKLFKYRYLLAPHEDSHIGIKRYFCEICQKAYRSEKDHKNMHKRGRDFKCEVCSKCFNTKSKLAVHINTHSKDRELISCGMDGCTKTFISMVGLQRHRNQHDGIKNFICHLCSRKFIDKYCLETHLRRHTNERKYQCSHCDKKFFQSSAKLSHERRHTNTRNHPCSECNQSFYTPAALRRHMLSHTKILNEKCRFCSKCFARRDNRRRHEMVMHGVSAEEKTEFNVFK